MSTIKGRLYQEIGQKIKQDILCHYEVGARLPTEREISEKYAVGRSVVREAIIMLELENLVEVKKGSGIYLIAPVSTDAQNDFEHIGPFEHLQARQIIESDIAKFAAMQAGKADVIKLRQALQAEEESLQQQVIDDTSDELFHTYLAEATQNSAFVDILHYFWKWRASSLMWKGLHSHIQDFTYREKWLTDHQEIYGAIHRKDPDGAYDAMWQHLENVKNTLLKLSDSENPGFDGYLYKDTPKLVG